MSFWRGARRNWFALALCMGAGGVAHADATDAAGCFTPVGGIDGVDPAIDVIGNGVNDARWNGGFGYGWETGALGVADFKAISDVANKRIFLSWRRRITASSVGGNEGVQVGFGYTLPGSSEQISQVIRVTFSGDGTSTIDSALPQNADLSTNGIAPGNVQLFYKKGTGELTVWHTNQDTASGGFKWVYDNTRMYVLKEPATDALYWVVQMTLPIKSASDGDPAAGAKWVTPGVYVDPAALANSAGTTIPYWADLIETLDPGLDVAILRSYPDPGLSDPSTPNYQEQNRDQGVNGIGVPDPARWAVMQPGSPVLGTCDAKGLTFRNTDIINTSASGIAGANDGSIVLYSSPSASSVVPFANDFRVKVTNGSTTSPVTPKDITAAFSIAPYGSQTGARTAAWYPLNEAGNQLTCSSPPGPNASCTTPYARQITAATTSTTPVQNGGSFTLDTTSAWKPHQSYLCAVVDQSGTPYRTYSEFMQSHFCDGAPWLPNQQSGPTTSWDGLPFHTCMQVELSTSGTSTGGVTFANKSAFRNMYTVKASTYREAAIIDTRGLPKSKTTVNGVAGHYIYLFTETRNMPASLEPSQDPGPSIMKKLASAKSSARTLDYNQLAQLVPTMAIHTFWDTGKTTVVNKRRLAVLEPMTSYGNFVTHDYEGEGPIYGWDAHLEGATQVGPNTYRLFVPNEGRASVTTNIEAFPSPRCSGTVKPTFIVDLVKSLLQLIGGSSESGKKLASLVQATKAPLACADLNAVLDAITKQKWGSLDSWVRLLVSEIKTASGCDC